MRRVRRKGGNKEKVFGCDLLEHLNASSQEIPLVLKCCSEFVETNGIVDGIYRLSGVSSNIQKLRGEFESDGTPDLNKDLYLQDIHCVSSLCKAYFRELPNPLLTYQLYDKFAEAVAIQLEEERLVKIRDVLKELPRPHYRTLEFLMRHLVRMASYSSETNMHARNLAIVWAPNLLRSKDIEASGFNGTAAFMEVRVQSIVVEFILTHVPQLFPEQGVSNERRNSLPSPSAAPSQEEVFFRSAAHQPVPNFGNISPGDGPLAMRPYHAIIEGTDKRKGSLKGRKWMSIFNIGGRFHDPRRRHKNSAKEKDRTSLRPARSMDSLSSPSFPNDGSRRTGQRPPSTTPLATPSPQPGSDTPVPSGPIGGSEYAVTFRRGTGLVSGGSGTQGTYTALDPEGLGVAGNENLQSRSPGQSSKVGRRAAMHITGPTMVTVPLHITSNLAQGVLQGGGGDRVIHRGRDKDRGDKVEGKEGGEKESKGMEWRVEEGTKVEEEEKVLRGKETDSGVMAAEEGTVAGAGGEEGGEVEEREKKKEEEKKEEEEEEEVKDELVSVSREQRAKSVNSNNEGGKDEDAVCDNHSEYMDMKGMNPANVEQEVTEADDRVFDASEILNSTEMEGDDLGLSGYVEDNFEFLDQMDCSVMDHMDCSVSYQVNEFSVEPPCHSDDEYEVMAQAAEPAELHMHLQPGQDSPNQSPTELKPRRPLSLDVYSRHTKSLSLPHMTSPVQGPEESSSEDEAMVEDSEDDDYSSGDDMFVKSLPPDFFLKLTDSEVDTDCCAVDEASVSLSQSSEEEEGRPQTPDPPAGKESAAGDEALVEEEKDEPKEKETTETVEENHQERDQPENNRQSKVMEEDDSVMEDAQSEQEQPGSQCCTEDPPQSNDDSDTMPDKTAEEVEKEVVDNPHDDIPHCSAVSCVIQEERADDQSEESRDFSVKATEPPRTCTGEDTNQSDGDEDKEEPEVEDTCGGGDVEISAEKRWEENTEQHNEVIADLKHEEKMQESGKERHIPVRRTSSEISDDLGDVICEVLEDLERKYNEENGARGSVGGDGDGIETVEEAGEEEEEEQVVKVSGEEMGEAGTDGTDKTELKIEVVEDSTETKLTDTEKEFEEKDTSLTKTSELDEATKRNDEAQHRHREEEASKKVENERADEQDTPPSVGKRQKDIRSDVKESKEGRKGEESDSIPGGVGRKLIATKHPKVYQVKAVPVVPPKPQHCKITALTIRQQQQQQQQQQRERRDADRGRETTSRVQREVGEQGRDGGDGDEGRGRKEKPALRGGEKERERKGDGDDGGTRDASRNSPLSMCFDEAVAIATMRREKEKECEREKERHWGSETQ